MSPVVIVRYVSRLIFLMIFVAVKCVFQDVITNNLNSVLFLHAINVYAVKVSSLSVTHRCIYFS